MDNKANMFRKDGLNFLKNKYNKTTDDFIKDTYPKKDQANMRVKISRLINKPVDSPHYFDILQLAQQLSDYFNQFLQNGDYHLAHNFFLGKTNYVNIVGASYGNAQIGLYKKNEIKKIAVPTRYAGYQAITTKNAISSGMIRLFKPRKTIYPGADNRFGLAQDKKSKIIWIGYIEPRSNGRYDILDKSVSTGKTIQPLVEDINLLWSSRVEASNFPNYWDY